ncbi:unnamed protein product [Oikopleura dioica]|uniref:Uncharacterized protein n=1 Tax=Oikopleura dioica TaxID=34765 RepID=E4YJ47_OIKDI|nr:unnamed protein product [Oikopleura dioica]
MRSVSPFNADNEITLWIKKTCLTIDYKNPPELLRTMNYLCSYLICQLRESHFITPPDKKPAIVFMLRNMKSVNKCINSLIPTVTLDKVVISLPSTKEFLILNGTELEDGDTYSRFKDLAFFPSGIIEVLPKPFELNHPSPNIPWEDVWANIKKETSETQRRSFCSSFYSKSSICEDQEENLKALLDISELNKKAILNLLKSGTETICESTEKLKHWTLKPRPDTEEGAITTANDPGKRICLPGKCSYILMWKSRRTINWRDPKIDLKNEHKYYFDYPRNNSTNFLSDDDITTLKSRDKERHIDESPDGISEIAPKRLTQAENNLLSKIKTRRWPNVELWNPFHSITRITETKILKIWQGLYNELEHKLTRVMKNRNINWLNKTETLSLIAEYDGRCNTRSKDLLSFLSPADLDSAGAILEKITILIKMMRKIIKNKGNIEHANYLEDQIKRGASCFSIIQNIPRMERSIPFDLHPPLSLGGNIKPKIFQNICWIIAKLCPRSERIWSKLAHYEFDNKIYCRTPKSTFQCRHNNIQCMGQIVAWFTTNMQDTKNFCESSCGAETNQTHVEGEPRAKKRKLNEIAVAEELNGETNVSKLEQNSTESLPSMSRISDPDSHKTESESETPIRDFQINSRNPAIKAEPQAQESESSSLEIMVLKESQVDSITDEN